MAVGQPRKWPLRRGIEPDNLLGLVRNTAPWLFAYPEPPFYIERLQKYGGEELGIVDYFVLCCCAHWATCGTPVPTDVDNAIRGKLWELDETTPEAKLAMAEWTLKAARWDYRPVTARVVTAPSGQYVSMHEGTWFSVAVGAYAAHRGTAMGERIMAAIVAEAQREDKLWQELVSAGEGLDILRASALIAHNFGDLDRVADMWRLAPDDPLRRAVYDAAKPGSPLFGGRLGWAGAISQRFLAAENHRYFALREPRFLRSSRDFLVPIGPFLDAWGMRVAREPGELVGEAVRAILDGIARTPGSVAYSRALAGILEAFPGGMSRLKQFIPSKDERLLSAGTLRAQISIPRERFEAQWARYWRQVPRP